MQDERKQIVYIMLFARLWPQDMDEWFRILFVGETLSRSLESERGR